MNARHLLCIPLLFSTLAACGGGTDGGTEGKACMSGSDCTKEQVCAFADGACGAVDKTKKCIFFAPTCGESAPVTACGCDGKSFASACLFGDVDTRPGACPPPAGSFWCGNITCALGQDYCNLGDAQACMPLPAACAGASADCSCFGQPSVGCTCGKKGDGHFELSCPPVF